MRDGLSAYNSGNYAVALRLFRPLADRVMRGNTTLGLIYKTATGVLEDDSEAIVWFRRAAEQGLARSTRRFGHYVLWKQNTPEAVKCIVWRPEQAIPRTGQLGRPLRHGTGIPWDFVEAKNGTDSRRTRPR